MNRMLVSLVVAGVMLGAKAAPETSQPAAKPHTISVSGSAVGYLQPDAILWTVTRECTGKTLAEAKERSEAEIKTLVDGCVKKGVLGGDISLGLVRIQDALARSEGAAVESARRFGVSRTVTIRQRDTSQFQETLALLSDGNGKVKYSMYCSKVDKITRDTLIKATQAAKDKAAAMAGVLGAALGPVYSINEYPPAGSAIKEENVLVDESSTAFGAEAEKVRITVFVTFELQ